MPGCSLPVIHKFLLVSRGPLKYQTPFPRREMPVNHTYRINRNPQTQAVISSVKMGRIVIIIVHDDRDSVEPGHGRQAIILLSICYVWLPMLGSASRIGTNQGGRLNCVQN